MSRQKGRKWGKGYMYQDISCNALCKSTVKVLSNDLLKGRQLFFKGERPPLNLMVLLATYRASIIREYLSF
tara:strand:- start:478 stop:690 length:213 start_codon:yes stop_codon:yes gene_type:complete